MELNNLCVVLHDISVSVGGSCVQHTTLPSTEPWLPCYSAVLNISLCGCVRSHMVAVVAKSVSYACRASFQRRKRHETQRLPTLMPFSLRRRSAQPMSIRNMEELESVAGHDLQQNSMLIQQRQF